jgi:acyl-coenzyme A synthetase/AMP-(fatty) acid ligase
MSIGEIIMWGFAMIGIVVIGAILVVVIKEGIEKARREREEEQKAKKLLQEVELKNYILREIEQAQKDGELPRLFWRFANKKVLAEEYENSREHREVKWKEEVEKKKSTKPPF